MFVEHQVYLITVITAAVGAIQRSMKTVILAIFVRMVAKTAQTALSAYAAVANFLTWIAHFCKRGLERFHSLDAAILVIVIRNMGSNLVNFFSRIFEWFSSLFRGGITPPSVSDAARETLRTEGALKVFFRDLGAVFGKGTFQSNLHHLEEVGRNNLNGGLAKFGQSAINSKLNTFPVPNWLHTQISALSSSGPNSLTWMARNPQIFGTASRLRQWMYTQPWEVQWRWGYNIMQHGFKYKTLTNFNPSDYGLL